MGSQDGWAATLTTAELRLLPLLASHWSFREIGDQMFLSRNTIRDTGHIDLSQAGRVVAHAQVLEKAAELGLLIGAEPADDPPRRASVITGGGRTGAACALSRPAVSGWR